MVNNYLNFGSIDGDPSAAYRYTEARLHEFADDMVENLKYDTVDMKLSFNEKKHEPVVLPATLPNLLVNGVTGIAVGMMTNIPTHNLTESIDTIIYGIDNPGASTKELLTVLKGPDFPTGGIICNKSDLASIYESGLGNITLRGKHVIETAKNKTSIVITEIPYTLSGKKEAFVESIIKLAHSKKELQITSVRDESSKEGIRIVIDVKKDMNPDVVISYLYKFTSYEDTFKFSFLCLDNGKPVAMSLSQYVESFINFQKEIYTRKYNHIYNKNKIQIERLKGLIVAYDYIDQIIAIVRNANSYADMKNALMTGNVENIPNILVKDKKIIAKFSFSEIQSQLILEMKLHEISKLKVAELESDLEKLEKENKRLEGLLKNNKKLLEDIKKNLEACKTKYKDKRKTTIQTVKSEFKEIVENYGLSIDENNYAKRIKISASEKGYGDDEKLCVIVEDGGAYLIPLKSIPLGTSRDKGMALENFVNGEKILISFVPSDKCKVLLVDSDNYGKIINSEELICSRKYLKGYLKEHVLTFASILDNQKTIEVSNDAGKKKTFKISELPELSRTAKGRKIVQGKFVVSEINIK